MVHFSNGCHTPVKVLYCKLLRDVARSRKMILGGRGKVMGNFLGKNRGNPDSRTNTVGATSKLSTDTTHFERCSDHHDVPRSSANAGN